MTFYPNPTGTSGQLIQTSTDKTERRLRSRSVATTSFTAGASTTHHASSLVLTRYSHRPMRDVAELHKFFRDNEAYLIEMYRNGKLKRLLTPFHDFLTQRAAVDPDYLSRWHLTLIRAPLEPVDMDKILSGEPFKRDPDPIKISKPPQLLDMLMNSSSTLPHQPFSNAPPPNPFAQGLAPMMPPMGLTLPGLLPYQLVVNPLAMNIQQPPLQPQHSITTSSAQNSTAHPGMPSLLMPFPQLSHFTPIIIPGGGMLQQGYIGVPSLQLQMPSLLAGSTPMHQNLFPNIQPSQSDLRPHHPHPTDTLHSHAPQPQPQDSARRPSPPSVTPPSTETEGRPVDRRGGTESRRFQRDQGHRHLDRHRRGYHENRGKYRDQREHRRWENNGHRYRDRRRNSRTSSSRGSRSGRSRKSRSGSRGGSKSRENERENKDSKIMKLLREVKEAENQTNAKPDAGQNNPGKDENLSKMERIRRKSLSSSSTDSKPAKKPRSRSRSKERAGPVENKTHSSRKRLEQLNKKYDLFFRKKKSDHDMEDHDDAGPDQSPRSPEGNDEQEDYPN